MSVYSRNTEKRKYLHDYHMREEDYSETYGRDGSMSPPESMDSDKKVRREIANQNERRRMQSINAGFQSLKTIIPHHDGEKMSKSAILQATTDYISNILQEKEKLAIQNNHLKKLLADIDRERICEVIYRDSPPIPPKRKKRDTESSDEGILQDYEENAGMEELKKELNDVRNRLDREQMLRKELEDEIREYNARINMYSPEQLRLLANQVNVQRMAEEKMLGHHQLNEETFVEIQQVHVHKVNHCTPESMSRRNLETIVEAIRHLEGGDEHPMEERNQDCRTIPQSEESDIKDSSESDDLKSEYSDRDSPYYVQDQQSLHPPPSTYHHKYPIAANLLQPMSASQYMYRPGVIVHNS